jgi:BirA family biotin operon repressor/biotin-[acetyl-CoA-carboxylase] ligase
MYPTHHIESTFSTNILAREMADRGAVHGAAIIAADQTAGRGRLGKTWHSKAGKGLYCSIIVRPELAVEDYPKITLATGVAVAQALDRITGGASQLKWPNDIYFSGKKCGGILTESSALNTNLAKRYAIVGIGINVNNSLGEFPLELRDNVTSLCLVAGQPFEISEVFVAIRDQLLSELDLFCEKGFAHVLDRWRGKDFLLGKKMQCVSTDKMIVEGVAVGTDVEGLLHVKDAAGVIHQVLSGDVRLADGKK